MLFLDLKAQYKSIKKEIDAAIKSVVESGIFIGGPEVENFEKEIAQFCGTKYAIGVNSGTDALLLALRALEIGPGDEVITTPFTFIATAEVISAVGAKPVFVDIEPKTFNINPVKIEEYLKSKIQNPKSKIRPKALLPVHLFGQMAEMGKIMKIAKKYKLFVIEDAAQAIGATISGFGGNRRIPRVTNPRNPLKSALSANKRLAGSIGDVGCFSFFPSKNLGAYGDGGMIVTNNEKIAEKIKLLRNHGSSPKEKYKNLILGTNSRLDAIQTAILRVKLKYLEKWSKKRAEKAEYYNRQLVKIIKQVKPLKQLNKLNSLKELISPPYVAPDRTHIFHQYTIRVSPKLRNDLITYLRKNNIPTMIYYPLPLHLQPAFKFLGYKKGDFPETEKAAKEVLSLPIFPEIKKREQDYIIQKVKNFTYNE